MSDALVSVIIPVYNTERYLKQCLDSIKKQTIFTKLEVICVNDGSTDNSEMILRQYEQIYNNIMVINTANGGAGKARNCALNIAKGKYVGFMDADDYYPTDDVLEILYICAMKNNALICGGSLCLDLDGKMKIDSKNDEQIFSCNGFVNYIDYQKEFWYQRFIYDRNMLIENKIYFPYYIRFQDPPFFVKAMLSAQKFYTITKSTYCYRKNDKRNSFTVQQTTDALLGMIDVLKLSKEHRLPELHFSAICRINNFLLVVYRHILCGNENLKHCLLLADQEIDYELIDSLESLKKMNFITFTDRISSMPSLEKLNQEKEKLIRDLRKYEHVIIYGAGFIGQSLLEFLTLNNLSTNIHIAVTDLKANLNSFKGYPIHEISNLLSHRKNGIVVIAVQKKYQTAVYDLLKELKFENIVILDSLYIQLHLLQI